MDFARPSYTHTISNPVTSSNRGQRSRRHSLSYPGTGTQAQTYRGCTSRPQMRRTLQTPSSSAPYIPPFPGVLTQSPVVMPVYNTPSAPCALPYPMAYAPEHIPPVLTITQTFPLSPPPPQVPPPQIPPLPSLPEPSCSPSTPNIALRKLCDEDGYRLMVSLPVGHREDGTYGVLPDLPDNENYTMSPYYADLLTYYNVPEPPIINSLHKG